MDEYAGEQGKALGVEAGPRMERLEPGADEQDRDEVENGVSVCVEYKARIA